MNRSLLVYGKHPETGEALFYGAIELDLDWLGINPDELVWLIPCPPKPEVIND
jgi:hypothetical protein